MNTRKGRSIFKNFRVLLDSGCSSTIVMGRPIEKLHPEQDALIQWNTQAGNITTNNKVKVNFTLKALSAKFFVTWNCHVDDSNKSRYDMILGRDLLT